MSADLVAGEAVAASIGAAVAGRFPEPMDVENDAATMLVRALPLQAPGGEEGALVLVRDVTDVRRRDRALMTKDATIREIHHRVKNNLQTVAALLRLQARRMTEPAARAALEESVRRVASIAVVHETLAGSREDVVEVDDVLDQVLPMLGDVTSVGPAARITRVGKFGELPAAAATPLVMAVTELLHNAAEHAFHDGEPGTIVLAAERDGDDLVVRVRDDGRGLPPGFDPAASTGLGLQIVRTLVTSELHGTPADGRARRRRAGDRGGAQPARAPAAPAAERSRGRSRGRSVARSGPCACGPSGGRGPRSGGADPGAGGAALQGAALVLGQAAPDAGVLAGAQGPLEAGLHDRAATAHGLGLLDLDDRRARRPDREEELRVFVPAERAVAPVHGGVLLDLVYGSAVGRRSVDRPRRSARWCSARSTATARLVTGRLLACDAFTRGPDCQAVLGLRSGPRESKLTTLCEARHSSERRSRQHPSGAPL